MYKHTYTHTHSVRERRGSELFIVKLYSIFENHQKLYFLQKNSGSYICVIYLKNFWNWLERECSFYIYIYVDIFVCMYTYSCRNGLLCVRRRFVGFVSKEKWKKGQKEKNRQDESKIIGEQEIGNNEKENGRGERRNDHSCWECKILL